MIVLLAPSVAVMVMRVDLASFLLLNILLQRCVILLRRREVAALQTLRQGGKGLSDRVRIRGGGRGRGGVLRVLEILRQRGVVFLSLRQVAGLQVLSKLLKFGFKLLQPSLAILSALRS